MNKTLFRQIPIGSKLQALGNFFKPNAPLAQWRIAAQFLNNGQAELLQFPLEMSCVFAVGREFTGKVGTPYQSGGFKKMVQLPALDTWRDRPLGECPRLAKKLAASLELSSQRCFVFEANGMTVWLPKFELARKLFFHASVITRAAFEPNGLDMVFTRYIEEDGTHFHTPAKTGVPRRLIEIEEYRNHFSWMLLNQDVKRSFESIWQRLNDEQKHVTGNSAYARWKFDFKPPASLEGITVGARGPFDSTSNELLVWEIETLQGLRLNHSGDIFFHHPALKRPVKGNKACIGSAPAQADEIEVDAEEEPTDAKEPRLIHLPIEGLGYNGPINTTIAYEGERASGHGKKIDDAQWPNKEKTSYGVADPVIGGSIAPGEFQKLGESENHEQYANRFSLLREIIEQISQESEIVLLTLEVGPLPLVARCSYSMIDNEKPRCYLLAKFKQPDGSHRYLLEIDTSDKRTTMSTRIMGFKARSVAKGSLDQILKEAVKGSLRWPTSMSTDCDPMRSVNHPKDSPSGITSAQIFDWKVRIRNALS
ncbi:Tn7-like element transposition protein TnsE [Marinobacter sp. BSs20148]|uniref:Tn7-like element transposition protein TnsE n=1 Tax=Marinobacter sp. BSs20148 TaxID=490759 RepID=UPI0002777312|nr:Tn7-like element transposition protein TnsE [Marinobacter sp. BSs20148]AFP32791.1 Transposon Tn7 transposition protein tnsE [Marinobacter sp. BSs20148]